MATKIRQKRGLVFTQWALQKKQPLFPQYCSKTVLKQIFCASPIVFANIIIFVAIMQKREKDVQLCTNHLLCGTSGQFDNCRHRAMKIRANLGLNKFSGYMYLLMMWLTMAENLHLLCSLIKKILRFCTFLAKCCRVVNIHSFARCANLP